MSVIIDTTKSELEAVIRYARDGANNCMIGNGWEIKELVRCKDCKHTFREDDHEIWCAGRGSPCQLVAPDGFCDKGRRSE